jgi:Fe-S oxidoreductase
MRLLAESFEIFVVTNDTERIEKYRKHLFDDSEVEELACTLKATTHCGAMIASMMVGMYNNFLTNLYYKEQVRDLPFHVIYDMALVNLQILDK